MGATYVSAEDIESATEVLRQIAAENGIGVLFNQRVWARDELGERPTINASLIRHNGVLTAVTLSPAATPNVVEPLMHEMGHAILGFPEVGVENDETFEQDRDVLLLEIKWADRLPPTYRDLVIAECKDLLKDIGFPFQEG